MHFMKLNGNSSVSFLAMPKLSGRGRTLVYSPHQVLALFARAEQHQHFKTLCDLIEVTDKGSLVDSLTAAEKERVGSLFQGSLNPTSVRALTNLDKLDTLA